MFILDLRVPGAGQYSGPSPETTQMETTRNRLMFRSLVLQAPQLTYQMIVDQGNSHLISLGEFNQLRGLSPAARAAELYSINDRLTHINNIRSFQQSYRNEVDQFLQRTIRSFR